MADAVYPKAKEAMLSGLVDLTQAMRVYLIDGADYTYSTAHDFLDDVPAGARVANATLANQSVVNGIFDADDITFPNVTGDPSEILILVRYTGADATSRLVAYIDSATGLPVTPNGGGINVNWDNGANKIFAL